MRKGRCSRKTRETAVDVCLDLDGTGAYSISTGIGFFDHMLEQIALHGGLNLEVSCRGDLEVDCHHTVEDTGIAFGQALMQALGNRSGIRRYATSFIPMDEALARSTVDLGGRAVFVFQAELPPHMLGAFDSQMCEEFFRAISSNALITLHMREEYGNNVHHIVEALFKSFAHALKDGAALTGSGTILSTKGTL